MKIFRSTQSSLAIIIFASLLCMTGIGVLTFFKSPNDPGVIDKIIVSLGGVILLAGGAKAGLSMPGSGEEYDSSDKKDIPEETSK